jgi:hypothetical protein
MSDFILQHGRNTWSVCCDLKLTNRTIETMYVSLQAGQLAYIQTSEEQAATLKLPHDLIYNAYIIAVDMAVNTKILLHYGV